MRRQSCVLFLLLSILGLTLPASAQQVGSGGKQDSGFHLEQNYPNPFNPETKIPFVLFDGLFVDGKSVVVSVRIFNVLQQFITAPTALNHPGGREFLCWIWNTPILAASKRTGMGGMNGDGRWLRECTLYSFR